MNLSMIKGNGECDPQAADRENVSLQSWREGGVMSVGERASPSSLVASRHKSPSTICL